MKKSALLFVAVMACGGNDNHDIDTSGLVGVWRGIGTIAAGTESAQATASVGLTANGSDLSVGGLCLDSSVLKAFATDSTKFTVTANQNCPLVASTSATGCKAITLAWTSGHGTLENTVLTISTTGTLSGCGTSLTATYNFNGRK
jgi:hypothetical protein